ncbi:conserved Plasmodium protein, unknown function [Plasmodium ovale wallikeri]|uniref:Uncharacterized protein n=1 Tax=Plasmodium ovale wallikeri TaxID=864142 RepID=A0A1A8YP69_PLAOA|nr:conserved Plasmodium protein, unknown function [Plasmodium ovale wallikeri]SBT33392.1 conserved Plasmodium protein, unknown function [Plasmodium ovale wallikeri]
MKRRENRKRSEQLKNRVYYFFSTDEILDQTLFNLCKFIPNDKDILDQSTVLKTYNSETCLEFINSDTDSWKGQNILDDIVLNENVKMSKPSPLHYNLQTKKNRTEITCVEWMGFVNETNGYAAVKMFSPFVSQEYYTYVNRLVYFLFQKTNFLQVEDFLNNHNFIKKIIPLYMKCENKLCVRLSHIDASNDLYL